MQELLFINIEYSRSKENRKLRLENEEFSTAKEKRSPSVSKEIRKDKENSSKKSSADSTSPESSQILFKDRKTSTSPPELEDKSFSEIAENFKQPEKRFKPKAQAKRKLKQQTLTSFSVKQSEDQSDATYCEEIEGKKKSSGWIKKTVPVPVDNSKQLRQVSLEKSFSRREDKETTDDSSGLFQFAITKKTPPKEAQQPPPIDTDRTPDLTGISPRKRIKTEIFSEQYDIFQADDSTNSVIVIEESERPLTIVDSADDHRRILDSLENKCKNISEYSDASEEEPLFRQGTRYKDCDDCRKFYKEMEKKEQLVYEVRSCRTNCVGYLNRVAELRTVRKAKTLPPPKIRTNDDTPSGFWSFGFPKTQYL